MTYEEENACQNAIINTIKNKLNGCGHCKDLAFMVWIFHPKMNILDIQSQIDVMLAMDWLVEDSWGNIFLGFDDL